MKTAQDLLSNPDGRAIAGFNLRIYGHSYTDTFRYPHERIDGRRHAGWDLANKMIEEGKIYYLHNFHQSHECSGHAFHYGTSMVCNTCNRDHLESEWWIIKTFMDGNEWFCVGEDFVDIQESSCYALGDTKEEAIKNYGDIFTNNKGMWKHCSPALLRTGIDCATTKRKPCECGINGSHDHWIPILTKENES